MDQNLIKLTEQEQLNILSSANIFKVSEYNAIVNAQLLKVAEYISGITERFEPFIENDWIELTRTERKLLLSIAQKIIKEVNKEK